MNDEKSCCGSGCETSCNGGHCPPFLAKLPMERKVLVILGVLVLVFSFLASTVWSGFAWVLAALAVAMIYGGYTGNCLLTATLKKFCCEKGAAKSGSCCSPSGSCEDRNKEDDKAA